MRIAHCPMPNAQRLQVTNDVVVALRAFEAAGSESWIEHLAITLTTLTLTIVLALTLTLTLTRSESSPEGEQPVGVYVERMRANSMPHRARTLDE